MKRYFIIALSLICSFTAIAQNYDGPVKQWTSSFTEVDVDAPIKLTLTAIPADQAPYIVYDTKGVLTSKFAAEVDRDGVLKIRERYEIGRAHV